MNGETTPVRIVRAEAGDAQIASVLVHESFDRFVAADWTPDARAAFLAEASVEKLRDGIAAAAYAALAMRDGVALGFIYLPTPALLAMLFVHPQHLGQRIGSLLWEAARTHVETHHPQTRTVELNASSYGVPAYRAMGFYPISEPYIKSGAIATRMACWLPARTLERAPASR